MTENTWDYLIIRPLSQKDYSPLVELMKIATDFQEVIG
jgi:hypothetical protein